MGVDLHYFAEYRTPHGWALCATESSGSVPERRLIDLGLTAHRIYGLYAFLGEMRPLRGWPADLSSAGRELTVGEDFEPWEEGPTWLTLRELLEADWPQWLRETDEYRTVLPRLRQWGEPDDVRLVFWRRM
jgi:hypothetical protein